VLGYRVFISHSHDDEKDAVQIEKHLRRIGFRPIRMADLKGFHVFPQHIRDGIAYAHAFMPLLTTRSETRPWVQQEIGYAMGLEVPVVPVAIGQMPAELAFVRDVKVLQLDPDLANLESDLTGDKIAWAVGGSPAPFAPYYFAESQLARSGMLADLARRIISFRGRDLSEDDRIRHRAGLTSFSNPVDMPLEDVSWGHRYGIGDLAEPYCRALQDECLTLRDYATIAGCDLIVDISGDAAGRGSPARLEGLAVLRRFLLQMPEGMVRIVNQPRRRPDNLLLVGDWFVAESATLDTHAGYSNTVFTRHAPTVLDRIARFDRQFNALLTQTVQSNRPSVQAAIELIEAEMGQA
jgi:hypothetical protein